MKLIRVKAEHNYDVEIGVQYSSAIKQILNGHNKVLILAPASLIKQYKLKESKNLFLLSTPNGESQKNSKFLELIWKKAASAGIERTDAIIGFGGGATTDVAGFAAATWLRGINWYAIPTSLAGMVDAVVVIESKKSGGSLITADLANDYNKDVFAFPGNVDQVYSEGCNRLIQQQKAHLLVSGEQFLKEMNWLESQQATTFQRSCFIDLSEEEQVVCSLLSRTQGEHIDVLAIHTKTPISKMNVLLFHLEMKGVIQALPGKKYQLI